MRRVLTVLFLTMLVTGTLYARSEVLGKPFIRRTNPEYLSFEELKILSENPRPRGLTEVRLKEFFRTVEINNEAYHWGAKPHRPVDPDLGATIRVASWNIEKSLHIDEAIGVFTDPEYEFQLNIDPIEAPLGSKRHSLIMKQRRRLQQVDVLILQEMEIGIKRSQYRHAALDLAKALDMNYAYAPQYLEVDPTILGMQDILMEDGGVDQEAMDYYQVDPGRFKGVFGSAVLSRYPIKRAEVRPLFSQAYDWYEGEKKKTTFTENARRLGSKVIFKNELTREMKIGGRHYFRVDLHVPGIPKDTLTIINIHLEIKALPKARQAQLQEILAEIIGIDNPLIMMGDFNAAPTDISPTSLWRETTRFAKNPTTWLSAAVNYVSPHALAINTTRGVSNVTKNFNDPLAKNIKVVAPNPVKPMFLDIQNFEFTDGGVFDFRGDKDRSVGEKKKILANANQRGRKGFRTTFSVKRPIAGVIGKYRLDWAFVKVHIHGPQDKNGSYKLAPHFGETLEEMNTGLKQQVSDHHPNVFDLPLQEPII